MRALVRRARLASAIVIAALGPAGCGGDSPGKTPAEPPTTEPEGRAPNACLDESTPDNPIDAAFCEQVGPTFLYPASEEELCRRLFLDFTGAIPTSDELASVCAGRTPGEIVDALFERPRYVEMELRYWIAERLQENYSHTHGTVLVDADSVIADLATGRLSYPEFTARIIAHPAVTANQMFVEADEYGYELYHPEEVADRVIRGFLGRVPVGDEVDDLANLFRYWEPRVFSLEPPRSNSDFPMVGYIHANVCRWSFQGCTSNAFGETVTVELPLDLEMDYGYYNGGTTPPVPPEIQAELEKPGRLIAAQPEFWDAAADLALRRLLGWWRSTPDQPESEIPAVQYALGQWFEATPDRDIRRLYKAVATSLLYTTRAWLDPDEGKDAAPWEIGPTKPMSPEMWLDSAATATGLTLGFCDPHTDEVPMPDVDITCQGPYYNAYLRKEQPADLWIDPATGQGFDYYAVATEMGGCRGGNPRAIHPGMKALFAQLDVAARLCQGANEAGLLLPVGMDRSDLDAVAAHLFQRILTRYPTQSELLALEGEAACAASGSCEIPMEEAICGALLRSGAFMYY